LGLGQTVAITQPSPAPTGPFSISPALPAGLSISPATGVIYGIPTALSPSTTYTVNGTSSSNTIQLQVLTAYVVNDLGDTDDATPGDGICATATGTCTLRAAIDEANADGVANINIVIPSGTITLGSIINISSSVSLYGSSSLTSIIDGNSASRIFGVQKINVNISMQYLKLQHGYTTDNVGGGGAAIYNNFNNGDVYVGACMNFSQNSAAGTAGGGAISWWGPTSSTFTCTECDFENNTVASDRGGAVTFAVKTIDIEKSAFGNNGGGILAGAIWESLSTTVTIINNSFYGNKGGEGGAMYLDTAGATYTITNNTFANNVGALSGTSQGAGGIQATSGGVVAHMTNNIFYNNTGFNGNCDFTAGSSIADGGGNLESPGTTCGFALSSDLSVAPIFGPWQNNGGFSPTLAELLGSPTIDTGVLTSCPAVDQRNVARKGDGKCDIGAFELPP